MNKRTVQDEDEQKLIDQGWEFSGMGLFTHSSLARNEKSKSYTKQQALDMGLERDDVYKFIEQFVDPRAYIDMYKLADQAKELLDSLDD